MVRRPRQAPAPHDAELAALVEAARHAATVTARRAAFEALAARAPEAAEPIALAWCAARAGQQLDAARAFLLTRPTPSAHAAVLELASRGTPQATYDLTTLRTMHDDALVPALMAALDGGVAAVAPLAAGRPPAGAPFLHHHTVDSVVTAWAAVMAPPWRTGRARAAALQARAATMALQLLDERGVVAALARVRPLLTHPLPALRYGAAKMLAARGDADDRARVAACLRDPCLDVGHCAVDALARGEAPGVALCAVIDDDTVYAPVRAVAGQRGFRDGCFDDAQIDHLAALAGTSDPSLRWVGAAAAARLTPEAAFDRASPAVPRDCTRPESPQDVSQGADCVLQALVAAAPTLDARWGPKLTALLDAPVGEWGLHCQPKHRACELLARMTWRPAVGALTALAATPGWCNLCRGAALLALGAFRDDAPWRVLGEALQHIDATLNESARKAMEALDDPAALPWLRQAIAQNPYPERRAAFEALVEKLSRPPVPPPPRR